jgi:hypothetical protein
MTQSAGNMRRSWRVDNALRKHSFACNRSCGIVRQTSWRMKIRDIVVAMRDIVVAMRDNVDQRSEHNNKGTNCTNVEWDCGTRKS